MVLGSFVCSIRPWMPLRGAWTLERRLSPGVLACKPRGTNSGNSHEMRSFAHELRQRERPNALSVPPGHSEPRLDLGDLGAADRHLVRRRAVEFHDRAVAF